jgi:hypothetical protein
MDNGAMGDFEMVYNGEGVPQVRYFEAQITDPGRPYRFNVVALNTVGKSTASDTLTAYACDEPSGIDAPIQVAITQTSVAMEWS